MSFQSMDFGAMQQAYASFQQKHNQMRQELDDLARSVESKLGQWEDGAREAYFQAKAEWEKSADDISRILNQLGVVINSSSETGQATVKNNVSIIGG